MENRQSIASVSRRAFLTGGAKASQRAKQREVRAYLPWSTPERILAACDQCERCLSACPEGIIQKTAQGYPTVNFEKGECTFCESCKEACPQPVFYTDPEEIGERPLVWTLKAEISDACLAKNDIQCQSCQDHCDPRAIRFQYQRNAIAEPVIQIADCTGCGACVSVCPANCISIEEPVQDPADLRT
ncbi:ferredoxin-type protein NapF [Sneathiella aquimaris]|uniref:ferredoxin-type protein NapF n=1 Tax=Sneathiella aquimaris TaxID=2599305 RepID=UPI00146CE199|nr:ferredoxin-type protein NapF [Sneathiella aquimaris]